MSEKIIQAMLFAADKHKYQKRKSDDSSYIIHPFRVFSRLRDAGVENESVLIAALLHDTVEDTKTTFDEIEELFGPEVASLVWEVTDDKSLPKDERKLLQIQNAPKKSPGAKLIKLADKLDNLSGYFEPNGIPKGWNWHRVQGYFVWAWTVISGLRGTNEKLEAELDKLFSSRLTVDATDFGVLPTPRDMKWTLRTYLESMKTATD